MRDTLGLFIRALNSEVFTVSSEETLGAGRRGYLLISGVSSVETSAEGGETGCALIFTVGSAGANELPVYWSCIKTAKTQSTADKRILLRRKGLRRDRAGSAPTEHEKVLFIHTAEDVLTNFEIILSGEDGNHGIIRHLQVQVLGQDSIQLHWVRPLIAPRDESGFRLPVERYPFL